MNSILLIYKKVTHTALASCLAVGLILSPAVVSAQSGHKEGKKETEKMTHDNMTEMDHGQSKHEAAAVKPGMIYPLDTCPVSGGKLGEMGDPVVIVHEGREVRFCCKSCEPKFKADPAKYISQIDKQIREQQLANYPLDICVVSGEKLGSMGDPIDYVSHNRLVRFCCQGCQKSFDKEPEKYIAMIDMAAARKQKEAYSLKECVVSNEPLGEGAVDYTYGGKLVRFCCNSCVKDFEKNPSKYMAKINGDRDMSTDDAKEKKEKASSGSKKEHSGSDHK